MDPKKRKIDVLSPYPESSRGTYCVPPKKRKTDAESLYPEVLSRTYCVPPIHFNRVQYTEHKFAGKDVFVQQKVPGVVAFSACRPVGPPAKPADTSLPVTTISTFSSPTSSASSLVYTDTRVSVPSDRVESLASSEHFTSVSQIVLPCSSNSTATTYTDKNVGPEAGKYVPAKDSPTAAPCRPSATSVSPVSENRSFDPYQGQKRSMAVRETSSTHSTTSPAASAPEPAYSLSAPQLPKDTKSKLAKVGSCDVQDDFAQNHVLYNLRALSSDLEDTMFILSQYSFDGYLLKASKSKVHEKLPRPADLETENRRGDFDILIIHRKLGFLVGEIKSVGWNLEVKSSQSEADEDVVRKVETAVGQLEKSDRVIRYILHDILPELTVKKILILPYVSQADVQRILSDHPALKNRICNDSSDVPQFCCCSDQLSDPTAFWDVTTDVLKRLKTWWHNVWKNCPENKEMDDQRYLQIVDRFVGQESSVKICCPLSTRLEIRTQGEAVSELGRRLSLPVLTQDQKNLLDRAKPRVCVSGPPGTGKTMMVNMMGLKWLQDGRNVHVLSTRTESLAASHVVFCQLRNTHQDSARPVFFHQFDFGVDSQVEKALAELSGAARDGWLYVLMDEAVFSDSDMVIGPKNCKFIRQLLARVPGLHLWSASVCHDEIPDELEKVILTTPLRSAPVVLREVRPSLEKNNLHNYSDDLGMPAPSDGPRVVRLSHSGPSHQEVWPHQCPECGRQVAHFLEQLDVGSRKLWPSKFTKNSPEPLGYKDVFILTRNTALQDCGLVQGLRKERIPVCVLEESPRNDFQMWMKNVKATAEAEYDKVTVAHWRPVLGLERKVVVWLKERSKKDDDENRNDEEVEMMDRLMIVSRCTSQLVIVDKPPM